MDKDANMSERIIENNITVSMDGEISDNHITAELDRAIKNSKYYDNLKRVSGKVEGGHATLEGMVGTLADEMHALEVAKSVRGVKDVSSNLAILSSHHYDDASVKNRINQLLSVTQLSTADIITEVDHGKVTLKGYVSSRDDMEMAIELASEIEGVEHVSNKLKVRRF